MEFAGDYSRNVQQIFDDLCLGPGIPLDRLKSTSGLPNCIGCAVCFSRLSALMRRILVVRFAKPSESQRSRSRFR
jgi:hypothetical protein